MTLSIHTQDGVFYKGSRVSVLYLYTYNNKDERFRIFWFYRLVVRLWNKMMYGVIRRSDS